MKFWCKFLLSALLFSGVAAASTCKDGLKEKPEYASVNPRVFSETSKVEIEKTFLELIDQTGLNPKVPDLRRLRDSSRFYLVVPAQLASESGVLHLSYDIYRFKGEGEGPKAVVAEIEFISTNGHKVVIDREYREGQLLLKEDIQVEAGYTLFASLEGDIVKQYMRFMRPFASSRMSDGSMVPAHNLGLLAGVKSLSHAYNLRRYARIINFKNFLVEAFKRYGLYTLLGLTGIRQFFVILSRDRTEDRDEENEKLREELNKLLAEKKNLQITEQQFHEIDNAFRQLGREILEGEDGTYYVLKKVGNHYEALVEGDLLPADGSVVESTQGRYRKVKVISVGKLILQHMKESDLEPLAPPN